MSEQERNQSPPTPTTSGAIKEAQGDADQRAADDPKSDISSHGHDGPTTTDQGVDIAKREAQRRGEHPGG